MKSRIVNRAAARVVVTTARRATAAGVGALIASVAGFTAFFAAGPVRAADAPAAEAPIKADAAAGATKAAVCGACHGVTGNSVNPEWPNLAAQHHQYIVEQLTLFKATVRSNPIMQAQAVALTPQDMADVAAHFEAQTPTGLEADPTLAPAGEKLYRAGDAKRGLPACIGCHGPNGRGNAPAMWPQIRAQHSVYVYNQLKAYAGKTRYVAVDGGPKPPAQAQLMYDIAGRLTDDDMKALAAYLQGLR